MKKKQEPEIQLSPISQVHYFYVSFLTPKEDEGLNKQRNMATRKTSKQRTQKNWEILTFFLGEIQ